MKLVSGGQTGVDRAILDVALALGISCGGWCPKGRLAEDGQIPGRYPLQETPTDSYDQRTEWNVRDADGTLVLSDEMPSGGTALAIEIAVRLGKPCLAVDPRTADAPAIQMWLAENRIVILNVAGLRESEAPGIYEQARVFLLTLFAAPRVLGQ
jgi:hypothetical protein